MKKVKLFILISTSLFLLTSQESKAQVDRAVSKVGTTVAQFLKIGAGARPIALGGAYTALANDINSVYWNPAGLARIGGNGEATFNHAEWLANTQYDFAAFSLTASTMGSIGLHVISFRTPEEKVRTIRSPQGTGQVWEYNSIAIGGTFARNLTDKFSIGLTGKFIQEKLFNETARGAAFDIGVLYQTPFRNLSLGASITNFGTKMRLDGRDVFFNEDPLPEEGSVDQVPSKYRTESFDIPLTLRFGLAWTAMQDENMTVLAVADGNHPNDNSESINSGVEISLRNMIFLRGGYKALFQDNSEQGVTFGVGLRYDSVGMNVKLDFAWADYGRLDDVKFISFAIRY
jgi:hypothetical protein